MLLAIRERIMGFLGWVILGILFVAFAFFGLNSYLQDDVSSFAAVVNGEEISQAQYQQAYDQLRRKMEQQLGESFDPALLDENMLRAGSLQQLINQTLLIQAADSEGFAASNEQIALSINAVDAFKEDGVFSKDKYEQVLGYQGIRPAGFEHSLKQDIMANQFTVGVSATAAAPADNLVQAYVLEGVSWRSSALHLAPSLSHLLPLEKTAAKPPSEEELEAYSTSSSESESARADLRLFFRSIIFLRASSFDAFFPPSTLVLETITLRFFAGFNLSWGGEGGSSGSDLIPDLLSEYASESSESNWITLLGIVMRP